MSDGIRLNKYIALCGVASRRGADSIIEEGRVTINGRIAQAGDKVEEGVIVAIDGNEISPAKKKVVIAFYKPKGVTVTEKDEHANKIIMDYIDYPERVTYAGRLDKDSEGLILLTNDGDLINAMMKGANAHEKQYFVRVNKILSDSAVNELRNGVYIKDLDRTTRKCRINRINPKEYEVILTEGLNRQIRRMFSYEGADVTYLKRVRVINVNLDNLKPGESRILNDNEMNALYNAVGLKCN